MNETKPRHVLTEVTRKICLLVIRISFYVQVKNDLIQDRVTKFHSKVLMFEIFMFDKSWVCVMRSNFTRYLHKSWLAVLRPNFQVIRKPSSESIEYRRQSLVNWNTDEYILCFSLSWSRAVCWNLFKPENSVEPPKLRAGSRLTFADRESAIVIG